MIAKQRSFATILFVGFLDNLSVGILLPLLPLLFTSPTTEFSLLATGTTAAQGYILFGWLTAVYTIAQFIATPILGELSDRYGRRPILIASLSGTALAYLLFGYGLLTHQLPLLFLARMLDGITGGNISVAQAVVADTTEPQDRPKYYGWFGSALGLGFAIGPVIGAFFSQNTLVSWFNATTPFWVTSILAALSVLTVFLFLPETVKASHTDRTLGRSLGDAIRAIGSAFTVRTVRTLFSAIFVWRLGFGFWTTFGAVFLIYRFGFDQSRLGNYFLFVGSWLILSQLFLVNWFTKRFPPITVLCWSILAVSLTFALFLVPRDWRYLLWIIPFLASANALTFATIPSVVSDAATSTTQGKFSGMNNSVQALALSVSPILSGYLSASLSPISIVVIASTLMLVSWLIFVSYRKTHSA